MPRSGKNSRRGRQKDLIWFVRICCLCALIRGLENLETPFGKGFNCCGAMLRLRCAGSRFAKPRSFLKKVLIVAVRRCHCGGLIRGLQNLESPFGKGFNCCSAMLRLRCADSRFAEPRYSLQRERVVTFCIVQKVTKKHAGLRPATSIQSSAGSNFAKVSGGSCRNRFCLQNAGEKALNRCERVTVLLTQDRCFSKKSCCTASSQQQALFKKGCCTLVLV